MTDYPQRYRKKPVIIEAMGPVAASSVEAIAHWCGGRWHSDVKPSDPSDISHSIDIPTLEGVMTASHGDFVIKGVQGEFYPCKPDIFDATYEAVDE